jgi:hypothetical protein
MSSTTDRLLALLDGPDAAAWIARVKGLTAATFASEFATVTRRLGKAELGFCDADRADLARAGITLPPGLTVDELGRIILLLALPEAEQEERASDCFRRGDPREQRAVLRALPLLPSPARFLALAASACRTHIVPVFEAICCESTYPAAFFPDVTFHQMILKALFVGVALDRVVGLGARSNPELHRMVHDYAAERRAAGRSVPSDIESHFPAQSPP